MEALKVLLIISIVIYMSMFHFKFWYYYFGLLIPYYIISNILYYDAKNSSPKKKTFIAMWTQPYDPQIYGTIKFKINNLLEVINKHKEKTGETLSLNAITIKAIAKVFYEFKAINGKIIFGNYIPSKTADISILVPSNEGKGIDVITIEDCNNTSIKSISQQIEDKKNILSSGKDSENNKKVFFAKVLPTLYINTFKIAYYQFLFKF